MMSEPLEPAVTEFLANGGNGRMLQFESQISCPIMCDRSSFQRKLFERLKAGMNINIHPYAKTPVLRGL